MKSECAVCGKAIKDYRNKRFCSRECTRVFDFCTYEEAKAVVRQLGITSTKQYARRHGEDPRLPSNPWRKYPEYDVRTFFDKSKYDFHDTRAMLKRLNIRSALEYNMLRQSLGDNKLPSWHAITESPDYKNADDFFEKKRHIYTYDEAREAMQKFRVYSGQEYFYYKPYKHDTRLPGDPHQWYIRRGTWRGWKHFLNCPLLLQRRSKHYYPYEQCRNLFRDLGIRTSEDFQRIKPHKLDHWIPASPDTYYASVGSWNGWKEFLRGDIDGVSYYYTYERCRDVLREMGIWTSEDFNRVKPHKEDPLIPACPHLHYPLWKGWRSFLRGDMAGKSFYIGENKRTSK